MAEAYLRKYAGEKANVFSAGVEVHGLNPRAVASMKEDGIDISGYRSKNTDEFLDKSFDYILTVCDHASEACPLFPGKAVRLHHNFRDPAKASGSEAEITAAFRKVRNEIKEWCFEFSKKV
jgi:arsenate reductase